MHKKYIQGGLILCCLIFIPLFLTPRATPQPVWFRKCAHVKISHQKWNNPWDCAIALDECIKKTVEENPEAKILLMPEGAFPFPFNESDALQLWRENSLPKDVHLLFGAYRKENGKLYNSIYHVYECLIIESYDKSHCLFWTERTPKIGNWLQFLSLNERLCFVSGSEHGSFFEIDGHRIYPAICSECFCDTKTRGYSVLFVGEGSFGFSYIPILMRLDAFLKSRLINQGLTYVSNQGLFFDSQ